VGKGAEGAVPTRCIEPQPVGFAQPTL